MREKDVEKQNEGQDTLDKIRAIRQKRQEELKEAIAEHGKFG